MQHIILSGDTTWKFYEQKQLSIRRGKTRNVDDGLNKELKRSQREMREKHQ